MKDEGCSDEKDRYHHDRLDDCVYSCAGPLAGRFQQLCRKELYCRSAHLSPVNTFDRWWCWKRVHRWCWRPHLDEGLHHTKSNWMQNQARTSRTDFGSSFAAVCDFPIQTTDAQRHLASVLHFILERCEPIWQVSKALLNMCQNS